MIDINNTTQKLVGVVRTTVQALFAYVLVTFGDVLSILGVDDEFGALQEPVTALVVALALGLYWWVLTTLQETEIGKTPIIAALLGILMGGKTSPSYIDSTVFESGSGTLKSIDSDNR